MTWSEGRAAHGVSRALRHAYPDRAASLGRRVRAERGNAPVEFIGWTLVLVVPVLYLLVTLAQVQAAAFATASAADAASRILEVEQGGEALAHAQVAVGLALSDQRIDTDPAAALQVTCAEPGCGQALVRVEVGVDLPLLSSVGIGQDIVVLDAERVAVLATNQE